MSSARFRALDDVPTLHSVPEPSLTVDRGAILELDDHKERRVRLVFTPIQGIRVTTIDCFGHDLVPCEMVQVEDSPWIQELSVTLSQTDRRATFMERARHFLIPAGDLVIEIVAWKYEVEVLKGDEEL